MVSRPLTAGDVASLIATGEDSFTEFKDPATTPKDLAKELCAFLNTQGGRVLLGVSDEGHLLGDSAWGEERVMDVARTLLDPPAIPLYQAVGMPGGLQLTIVSVEAGVEKPYAVGGGEGKRYYIRVGSTSREASREELIRLTQASGAVAGDLRPVVGASATDLNDELLRKRFAGRRGFDWDTMDNPTRARVLADAEILHRETGLPTVAGLLCYAHRPQERLAHAYVACVAYPGSDVDRDLLDRLEATGRVEDQIESAVHFIERNLRRPSSVEGVHRSEAPRPSIESFREIVANAVAHRHYGIAGPVQLRLFADRLEVVSPGGLPNGVTPEAMRVGVTIRRNQFIVQHLVERGVIDALGRGWVLIVEEALDLGLEEPIIQTPTGFVVATMWLTPT